MAMKVERVKQAFESVAGLFIQRFGPRQLPATPNYSPHQKETSILSTGFRNLDRAVGLGGLPCGRVTELMRPGTAEASGNITHIAAGIAAKVQRKQQNVVIIDMAHSFDLWHAERCGLIAPHLLLSRPETVLDALTSLENAIHREGLIIVVMGRTPGLFNEASPELRRTLIGRIRNIVRQSNSVFLFLTIAQKNDPFSSINHPAGFPLSELADVRIWVQEDDLTPRQGLAAAYKATLAVIKNELALAGKGADIRIKFSHFGS
jgi:hypothetical protein